MPTSFAIDHFRYTRQGQHRFFKVLFWLASLVLCMQLAAMAFHHHDIKEQPSDCVSCYIASHLPTGTSKAPTPILLALATVSYRIVPPSLYFYLAEPSFYLTPHPQAPPRHTSP